MGRQTKPTVVINPIIGRYTFQGGKARQRELREVIRLGHANARGRRGQIAFGALDIRPAPQQIRRQSHWHCWRCQWDGLYSEHFV